MPNICHEPKNNYKPPQERIIFKVIKAKYINSYHYHGSWFEHTWELTVEDENGSISTKRIDTWEDYKNLTGKSIEYDGTVFAVISN